MRRYISLGFPIKESEVKMENVYSLFDTKAGVYSAPFLANSDNEARRILLDMCLFGGDNLIAKHTEDYTLVCTAQFDKHTGLFSAYVVVTQIDTAQNLVDSYHADMLRKQSIKESKEGKNKTLPDNVVQLDLTSTPCNAD